MKNPIVDSAEVLDGFRLLLTWKNGRTSQVDLSGVIKKDKALSGIASKKAFAKARPGLWGHSVTWEDHTDIGADTLWTLAHEQAGLAMPAEEFNAWIRNHSLSMTEVAEILGISRRMVIYYHMGHRPIPKMVGLACRGYDALREEKGTRKAKAA